MFKQQWQPIFSDPSWKIILKLSFQDWILKFEQEIAISEKRWPIVGGVIFKSDGGSYGRSF